MMKIRLQRVGRKHDPAFRLVAVDSRRGPQSGRFVEILGSYNPLQPRASTFKAERIKYWLGVGAQASGTAHNLLVDYKVVTGTKINVLPKRKPKVATEETPPTEGSKPSEENIETTPEETSVSAEEAPVSEVELTDQKETV